MALTCWYCEDKSSIAGLLKITQWAWPLPGDSVGRPREKDRGVDCSGAMTPGQGGDLGTSLPCSLPVSL